jgi:hypothetical protein
MHTQHWMRVLGAAALAGSLGAAVAQPPAQASAASESSLRRSPRQKESRHAHDFLIKGTVFTESALAFPGVEVRVRRSDEKKFRWSDYTNSRGEFAIRVPEGAKYELSVKTRGYVGQSKEIDATTGARIADEIVFRMELAGGKK